MKVITAVLIGAGLRGGWVYAAYAQSHPEDLKIVAVAEPDEERRNLIAEIHGIPEERCYQDYRELLEEEKMADCALVCTQDTMHFEPVTKALEKDIMYSVKNLCLRMLRKLSRWEIWQKNMEGS